MRMTRRSQASFLACLTLFCAAMTTPSPAQIFSTVANFNFTDGANPGTIAQGNDGNFYGVAYSGGNGNPGTLFKVSPTGTITTLDPLSLTIGLPTYPPAGLMQANDGNFYGIMATAGANDDGTVFKMTPSGTVTVVHNFNGTDGDTGVGQLVQGADGNLYGTTFNGGAHNECLAGCGTIFKITLSGSLTTIYNFCSQPNCTDGANPAAGLVVGADGSFYGTTAFGGTSSRKCGQYALACGTIFKITPSGVLTTLYSFCLQQNCPDGDTPFAGLVQGTDGDFYGTTYLGGAANTGTIFKMAPEGALTTLYNFCSQPNCEDGGSNYGGVVQASDGNFYGAAAQGGIPYDLCSFYGTCGTIFRITPWGVYTVLHYFNYNDGFYPATGVLQATDGKIYGSTVDGGANCTPGYDACGTVFSIDMGLAPFVELQPTIGQVGAPVTIFGSNLTGASVFFNNAEATIITNTGSAITTTVPAGATTGTVQVTVPSGNLVSNTNFQVVGPIQFVPVTPCRLVDTRGRGGSPIPGGTSQNFPIPQLGGCGIPTSAAAYSLNVTVVPRGPLGYLTIWPQGEIQPYVSTMNSPDGRTKANAAIVPSGNNAVSVYVSDTTDLILDIDGYFTPASSQTYQFYPLTPCRVVDTRAGSGFPPDLGPPSLQAQTPRHLPILSSSCLNGITNPLAYSFNVTVVPSPSGQPLGYLTVWPTGESQPTVSTLNNPTATVVANAAIVPAASNGDIDVYAYNSTDLIIDIDGYFAAPAQGGLSLYPVAPCRALDTRNGGGQPFMGQKVVNVVGSPCAPPSNAQAYVFNATVIPPGSMPYLTLWAEGQQQPVVSTLNAYDGLITSNMAIVPTTNGSVDAYAAGLTQLILDISGYFAP